MRVRPVALVLAGSLVLGACGGSPAPTAPAAAQPSNATAASGSAPAPAPTPSAAPAGEPTTAPPATGSPGATGSGPGQAGAFRVVLTGTRPGAGTYGGTAPNVTCISSPGSHGNTVWNLATLVDRTTGITHIALEIGDDGTASVLVEATEQIEFSPWSGDSSVDGQSATVDVVMNGTVANFHATASNAGTSIDVTISCIPLGGDGGGND